MPWFEPGVLSRCRVQDRPREIAAQPLICRSAERVVAGSMAPQPAWTCVHPWAVRVRPLWMMPCLNRSTTLSDWKDGYAIVLFAGVLAAECSQSQQLDRDEAAVSLGEVIALRYESLFLTGLPIQRCCLGMSDLTWALDLTLERVSAGGFESSFLHLAPLPFRERPQAREATSYTV